MKATVPCCPLPGHLLSWGLISTSFSSVSGYQKIMSTYRPSKLPVDATDFLSVVMASRMDVPSNKGAAAQWAVIVLVAPISTHTSPATS